MRFRRGVRPRPSYVFVLTCLLAVILLPPSGLTTQGLAHGLGLLGVITPVLAVAAAGEARIPRIVAALLAVLTVVSNGESAFGSGSVPATFGVGCALALLTYTTWLLFRSVVRSEQVTGDVIAGAMATYLLVGLTWAVAYGLVEVVRPGSIATASVAGGRAPVTFESLVYFSYMTLMTVGYGDMAPVAQPARTLAVLEGFVGVVFTTIIMAVLASMLVSARRTGAGAS
jgi:hypothetical protein